MWASAEIVLGAVNAAILLVYTVVTGFIWHATWRNTKATYLVLEAANRPYVGTVGANLEEILSPSSPERKWAAKITLSNAGTVPARKVRIETQIRIDGRPARPVRTDYEADFAIYPRANVVSSSELLEEELPIIQAAELHFDLVITIRYQGMNEKSYATDATYRWTGPKSGFVCVGSHFE